MKKILLLGLLLLCPQLAQAQTSRNPCYTTGAQTTQGIPNCVSVGVNSPLPVTVTTTGGGSVSISNLNPNGQASMANSSPVVISSDQTPLLVNGNVGSATTDSGNPIKAGARFNTSTPTFTDGQRTDLQSDSRGNLRTTLVGGNGSTFISVQNPPADNFSNSNSVLNVAALGVKLNSGGGWDRDFTCTTTAIVNVTAGNTTEIVALTAAQTIRVCSFSVAMSSAGTASWVYGTGTNCGTGTTSITGAVPLATGTPWGLAAGGGNSVLRSATSNALCLAAVTGNVVGFITYAKF